MIKKIFQCDTIPLTMLSLVLILGIYTVSFAFGNFTHCSTSLLPEDSLIHSFGTFHSIIGGVLIALLMIGHRRSIGRTNILDFNERVSLYPIGLVLLTVIPSCNSMLFLFASSLILLLFSRLVQIKEGESGSPAAFLGGIVVAVCSSISPYFILLTIFLWVALSAFSALTWRALVWSLLGLLSPIYLYLTISYIIYGAIPELEYTGLLTAETTAKDNGLKFWWVLYLIIFMSLFVLMSLFSVKSSGTGVVIRRKLIRLGFVLLIVTAAISAFIFRLEDASPFLSLMAVPLGIVFQEMYRTGRESLYNSVFLIWLFLTFMISWS